MKKRFIIITFSLLTVTIAVCFIISKYIGFDLLGQGKSENASVVISEEPYNRQEPEKYTIHAIIPILDNLGNGNLAQNINQEIRREIEGYVAQIENLDYSNLTGLADLVVYPKIISNKNGYFSLLIEGTIYTGGMHPQKIHSVYNVNVETGMQLTISSLFKANTDYVSRLEKIMSDMVIADSIHLYNLAAPKITMENNKNFYLSDGVLCIFYKPYEISPPAEGLIEFKIPLDKIDDILIEEIKKWG